MSTATATASAGELQSATASVPAGAKLEDWNWFTFVLGLNADLLPVVADPNATAAPYSTIKKWGKVPSVYTAEGEAHGLKDWQRRSITPADIAQWSADRRYSMCVRTSAVRAIDVDVTDEPTALRIRSLIGQAIGPLPTRARSNSSKFLLAFRLQGQHKKRIIKTTYGAIEFLADGQQFVCAGSHPSGARYDWVGGLPPDLPMLTVEQFEQLWSTLAAQFGTGPMAASEARVPDDIIELRRQIDETALVDLRDALAYPPLLESAGENDRWNEIGYSLLSLGTTGYQLFVTFSENAPNYKLGAPEDWWQSHASQGPRADYRHVFTLARQLGWRSVAPTIDFAPVAEQPSELVADETRSTQTTLGGVPRAHFQCTDQANANRLQAKFGHQLIVIGGQFYGYTGTHWEKDDSFASRCAAELSAMVKAEADAARKQFETLAADCADAKKLEATKRKDMSGLQDRLSQTQKGVEIIDALERAEALEKWAKTCESRMVQRNAIELLRSTRGFDIAKLNRDPTLLNCLSGTIQLRTGELRPHNPLDFITKCAPVEYDDEAKAPRFEHFLMEIMGQEKDRADFLQRWFGYGATGETREQKVLFHVGPGGGGKGTLLNAVTDVLGEYACTAARGLITGRGGEERHPTEIVDLLGRRLVTCHESDQGSDLREGFLKQLSGEDSLKGRGMRQDFIEFRPTHKIQLLTNYPPTIHGSDFGLWRRLLIVSYEVKFGSAEQVASAKAMRQIDPTLPEALRSERQGIFAWIVRGAVECYRTGLRPPESVLAATEKYRSEQDRIEQFVSECCTMAKDAWVSNRDLYQAYLVWCTTHGYKPLGSNKLRTELKRLVPDFEPDEDGRKQTIAGRRKTVRGCFGLYLKPDFEFEPVVGGAARTADSARPNNEDLR